MGKACDVDESLVIVPVMAIVAVFPAAGKIGSSIYMSLFDLVSPEDLLLISRSPEKIPHRLIKASVQTRKADYDDTESLEHAFDHVSCLVLISYPSIENEHRFKVCLCLSKPCLKRSPMVWTNANGSRFIK